MYKFFTFALIGCTFLLAADEPTAWKATVKDRFGNPMWEITNPRCAPREWPLSGCEFSVSVKNISGAAMRGPFIRATVRWASGESTKIYSLYPADNNYDPKAANEITECKAHLRPILLPKDPTVKAIDIEREGEWAGGKSPQEEAADKKSKEELEAAATKAREEREAEARAAQTACAAIYRTTVDKLQRDLTVREAKLVDYCTFRGWYGPE